MNDYIKEILGEEFDMSFPLNNVFDKEFIFLLKYLEGKNNHREKFDQLILLANGFKIDIHIFMDEVLSIFGNSYVRIIKKNKDYYIIELTDEGMSTLQHISYDKDIIRKNFIWNLITFIDRSFQWIIIKPIKKTPTFLKWLFSNRTAKFIVFLATLAGGIVAMIQIYKWITSGEI